MRLVEAYSSRSEPWASHGVVSPCTQAAADAAVDAAQQGRHGPISFRVPSISGGLGSHGGTGGVQKPRKKKQQHKPPGAAAPEVRKPPARMRRASARSESRDEEADGYEVSTPQDERPDSRNAPLVPATLALGVQWYIEAVGPHRGSQCTWTLDHALASGGNAGPAAAAGAGLCAAAEGYRQRPAGQLSGQGSQQPGPGEGHCLQAGHHPAVPRRNMHIAFMSMATSCPATSHLLPNLARLRRQAVSGHAEPEAASAPPPGPEIPPGPADIERVMDKVQKRDVFHIFKEPVTDAMVG
jgi:hypothetical protein